VVPVLTSEQGIGRGLEPLTALLNAAAKSGGSWHTTYSAIPHYVTSQLKSFFLEGSNYATFDMTANHEIKIQVFAPGFRSRAILGYSPLQHIEEYTIYAGRMKPIPSWLLSGPVIGYEGGTQKVLDLYAKLTNNNIKPTAFWLQDWSGLRIDTFGKRECRRCAARFGALLWLPAQDCLVLGPHSFALGGGRGASAAPVGCVLHLALGGGNVADDLDGAWAGPLCCSLFKQKRSLVELGSRRRQLPWLGQLVPQSVSGRHQDADIHQPVSGQDQARCVPPVRARRWQSSVSAAAGCTAPCTRLAMAHTHG